MGGKFKDKGKPGTPPATSPHTVDASKDISNHEVTKDKLFLPENDENNAFSDYLRKTDVNDIGDGKAGWDGRKDKPGVDMSEFYNPDGGNEGGDEQKSHNHSKICPYPSISNTPTTTAKKAAVNIENNDIKSKVNLTHSAELPNPKIENDSQGSSRMLNNGEVEGGSKQGKDSEARVKKRSTKEIKMYEEGRNIDYKTGTYDHVDDEESDINQVTHNSRNDIEQMDNKVYKIDRPILTKEYHIKESKLEQTPTYEKVEKFKNDHDDNTGSNNNLIKHNTNNSINTENDNFGTSRHDIFGKLGPFKNQSKPSKDVLKDLPFNVMQNI